MSMMKSTAEAGRKAAARISATAEGWVTFYAAVFGNTDLVGDIVDPHAFDKSLADWRRRDVPIPLVFSHQWDEPYSILGGIDPKNAIVDSYGLLIRAKLDIDTNPTAKHIHGLIMRGIVREASFAYDVIRERRLSDGANLLLELALIEAGPTLKGANPLTDPTNAKTLGEWIRSATRKALADERAMAELDRTLAAAELDVLEADLRTLGGRKSGQRNSAADQAHLDAAHAAIAPYTCEVEAKARKDALGSLSVDLLGAQARQRAAGRAVLEHAANLVQAMEDAHDHLASAGASCKSYSSIAGGADQMIQGGGGGGGAGAADGGAADEKDVAVPLSEAGSGPGSVAPDYTDDDPARRKALAGLYIPELDRLEAQLRELPSRGIREQLDELVAGWS